MGAEPAVHIVAVKFSTDLSAKELLFTANYTWLLTQDEQTTLYRIPLDNARGPCSRTSAQSGFSISSCSSSHRPFDDNHTWMTQIGNGERAQPRDLNKRSPTECSDWDTVNRWLGIRRFLSLTTSVNTPTAVYIHVHQKKVFCGI